MAWPARRSCLDQLVHLVAKFLHRGVEEPVRDRAQPASALDVGSLALLRIAGLANPAAHPALGLVCNTVRLAPLLESACHAPPGKFRTDRGW